MPEKQTARVEAFSDGVFAIAVTLLALELKVPHGEAMTAGALADALLAQWPAYFAVVTSFFTVLIMWVHHHTVFRLVYRADAALLFVNGFLLLLVTLVPYPTAVLAEYLRTPAASTACAFYAGNFVLIGIAFYLLITVAFDKSRLVPEASEATVTRLCKSYRWGAPCYAAAVIVAPYSPVLSLGICTALWILWAATAREC